MMLVMLSVINDDEKKVLKKLIIATSQGDKDALGEIYKTVGGRMLSVAMGIMRNKQLAEDVLHDSFLKIVDYCENYKGITNTYAWLCTIVRNTALDKIKSENLRRGADIDSYFDISDEGLQLEQRDRAIIFQNALKQLEARERTIIWLKYYNDMTVRNVANELNMSHSTVHDILKRAEQKLKNFLN